MNPTALTRMVPLAALLILAVTPPVSAQEYSAQVIASGLAQPTGIAVNPRGDVYFTQLPTPGIPGTMGGLNTVSVRDARTGAILTLSMGEPEPTNLALSEAGDLYWTCKSAGVILTLRHGETMKQLVRAGLNEPSGIAFGNPVGGSSTLYFTEVPTPGMGGGANGVFALRNGTITEISMGEPEPVDVAVDHLGNVYWTCRTAGVILVRERGAPMPSLLLGDLNQPTGIAVDRSGRFLYFTEVPEPGVGGGENRIWRYDLKRGTRALVHEGDPEPTDVAVGPDGTVYWTCTSAGVIVKATLDR